MLPRLTNYASRSLHGALACLLCLTALSSSAAAEGPRARKKSGPMVTQSPPQDAVEAYQRAREKYKAGQYEEAIEDLELALSIDKDSPELVYNVARVYELLGELGKAVDYYGRYRDMLPVSQDEERQRVEATIERLVGARKAQTNTPSSSPAPERGVADAAFWVTLGVGTGGVLTGAVMGGLALQKERRANDFVLGVDGNLDDQSALEDQARRYALASDVLFGAGAALGITAAVLYFVRTKDVERPEDSASIRIGFAPTRGGAFVSLRGAL